MLRAFFNERWLRIKSLLNRKQLGRDLEDELAHHLDMRAQHNRAAGMQDRREIKWRPPPNAVDGRRCLVCLMSRTLPRRGTGEKGTTRCSKF